jgi:transposase
MSAVARGAPVRGSKTCGGKTRWRQTAVDAREVLTGLFYVLWTGCQGAQGPAAQEHGALNHLELWESAYRRSL